MTVTTTQMNRTQTINTAQKTAARKTVTEADLPGIYVASIAIPGPYFKAEVTLKADRTYSVRVANIENGPSPAFKGTWKFANGKLSGEHIIPMMGKVTIGADLSKASAKDLRSGKLAATIAVGGENLPFSLTKTDKPFF